MAPVYSFSIVLAVHLLQAKFVRESLTSPASVLFCSPSERSPEFHNSSTSASCAVRQLDRSLELDRQGIKPSKDLRCFRITLWHSKGSLSPHFLSYGVCLPVFYWHISPRFFAGLRGAKGCQPRPKKTLMNCGQTQNSTPSCLSLLMWLFTQISTMTEASTARPCPSIFDSPKSCGPVVMEHFP